MRTLEQYEFHLWRLFTTLRSELKRGSTEDPERIKKQDKTYWNHREVFLDNNPEKRGENRSIRTNLKKICDLDVEDITKEDINQFRLDLSKDTLSVKSINAYIITFRSWLKYLKKEQIPCLDPTLLDLIKPPDREVTFLTDEEIKRFFSEITRENLRGKRDYAICQCIYSTGLRISELTSLNIRDVNLETQEFAVRGK